MHCILICHSLFLYRLPNGLDQIVVRNVVLHFFGMFVACGIIKQLELDKYVTC